MEFVTGIISTVSIFIKNIEFDNIWELCIDFVYEHYVGVGIVIGIIFMICFLIIACICTGGWCYLCTTRYLEYGRFKKGFEHNIFLHFLLDPPQPIVKQEPNREKINRLMQNSRFTHPEYVKEEFDVIIIGSGISALSSAGFLSKMGKKCLVLERHDRFGGLSHSFEEKGYEFCSGIHYINDAENPILKWSTDILTNSQIRIESIEDEEREIYIYPSRTIELSGHQTLDRLSKLLPSKFPKERKSLEKFFYHAKQCNGSYQKFVASRSTQFPINFILKYILGYEKTFLYYAKYTAVEILDLCEVKDVVLRSLLLTNQGLMSTHGPDTFMFPMCVQFLHIGWRKSRIVGGGVEFPRLMISNLENGSKALHGCHVKKILIKGGRNRSNGVLLESGERIYAKNVISSTGIQSTFQMLPKAIRNSKNLEDIRNVIKNHEYTGFYFIVHLGLSTSAEELELEHNQVVFLGNDDRAHVREQIRTQCSPENGFEGFEDCHLVAMCYDYNHEQPSKTKLTLLTYCFPEWFEEYADTETGKRGNEYEEAKEKLAGKMLDVVFQKYPKMQDYVEYMGTATTLTMRDYVFSPQGSSYGYNLTRDKVLDVLGNEKIYNPVKGIYLCGQDLMGDGVICAIMSSFYPVGKIIGRNFFLDFKKASEFVEEQKKEI